MASINQIRERRARLDAVFVEAAANDVKGWKLICTNIIDIRYIYMYKCVKDIRREREREISMCIK